MSPFIALEGPEGSGKSTQLRLLQKYLESRGFRVVATREPGGTPVGDQVRAILHDPRNVHLSPRAELLLYSASRAQLVDQVIGPALAAGAIVLCDRYAGSTLAYQGYGRGLDLALLRQLTEFATKGVQPDLVIYLDLPVEVGLRRKILAHEREGAEWTRMDQQELSFHHRVRAGYLAMAAAEPDRWHIVSAEQNVETVHDEIRTRVDALLANRGDVRS